MNLESPGSETNELWAVPIESSGHACGNPSSVVRFCFYSFLLFNTLSVEYSIPMVVLSVSFVLLLNIICANTQSHIFLWFDCLLWFFSHTHIWFCLFCLSFFFKRNDRAIRLFKYQRWNRLNWEFSITLPTQKSKSDYNSQIAWNHISWHAFIKLLSQL